MSKGEIYLKKNEDRRLRAGHVWIYSNEIDTRISPLNSFQMGDLVKIKSADGKNLGTGYINPHTLLCARLITRNPQQYIDEAFFIERLKSALEIREKFFRKPYYRLIFGESDGLPGAIVDRFGDYYVVQISTAGMDKLKDLLLSALITLMKPVGVIWKNDQSIRELEQLPLLVEKAYGDFPELIYIEENDCHFHAPIRKGQKTGWFYDHRQNRAKLLPYVSGKKVLDAFSYVGGWGVLAARWGASEVTCLDDSSLALDYVQQNARLNTVERQVQILKMDAFDALKKLIADGTKFDVILLDPPAFIKRQKDIAAGTRAYLKLNELALDLLSDKGILFSSSCSMHLSRDQLLNVIRQAGLHKNKKLRVLEQLHQSPDHPIHPSISETEYLKGFVVAV